MDVRQLKTDFRNGRVSADVLLDAVERLSQTVKRLQAEVDRLRQRLAQYEPEVLRETHSSTSPTPPSPSRYSLEAEEQRRREKHRRRRRKGESKLGRSLFYVLFNAGPGGLDWFAEGVVLPDGYWRTLARASQGRAGRPTSGRGGSGGFRFHS
jgi:hypothetical protein